LTYLKEYTEEEFELRVYDVEDAEFPFEAKHYACYDDWQVLKERDAINELKYPLRACSWRGMLRQGGSTVAKENFLKDIEDAMDWADGNLPALEFSDALYLSAAWFLIDLDGCHLNPD